MLYQNGIFLRKAPKKNWFVREKGQLGGSSSGADMKAPRDNNQAAVSGKEMSCLVGHVHCSSREAVLLEDS